MTRWVQSFARHRVIAVRARLSEPQRLLVALLIRFGATAQTLAEEDALRP